MVKRRYPFNKEEEEEEDMEERMEEKIRKAGLLDAKSSNETPRQRRIPEWMIEFIRKLPSARLRQARRGTVENIIQKLERARIPDRDSIVGTRGD